jgi:hypothetical protein
VLVGKGGRSESEDVSGHIYAAQLRPDQARPAQLRREGGAMNYLTYRPTDLPSDSASSGTRMMRWNLPWIPRG